MVSHCVYRLAYTPPLTTVSSPQVRIQRWFGRRNEPPVHPGRHRHSGCSLHGRIDLGRSGLVRSLSLLRGALFLSSFALTPPCARTPRPQHLHEEVVGYFALLGYPRRSRRHHPGGWIRRHAGFARDRVRHRRRRQLRHRDQDPAQGRRRRRHFRAPRHRRLYVGPPLVP